MKWNSETNYGSLSVDGVRIHWAELGQSVDRAPVVLLHGLNDCHLTWKRLASELGRDRRVLMPDLPGHGYSERPNASYELAWYAEVMAKWMAKLGTAEADLVGHSFGGGVAQMMLLNCRDRIRRIALVSSGGLGREIAVVMRLASIPFVIERLGQPFMAAGSMIALRLARDGRTAKDIAELSAMNRQVGSARAFSRTVRDIIDWQGQRRMLHQRVHEISDLPPILVLWGKRDNIIPVSHAELLAKSLEGVRLTLVDQCGHYPHCEQPSFVATSIREFLDEPALPPVRVRQ